jgi:type I restriction enzyme S subunit
MVNSIAEKSGLPQGWEKAKLGNICDDVSKRKQVENGLGEFTYIDINSIDNKLFKISEPKTYTWKDAPSRAQQIVKTVDILFSTVRTYLKNIAIVSEQLDNQIASTGFCVIRCNKTVNNKYLFYLSLTKLFLDPLNELQRGSSYPAVRNGDVFSQQIPLPPLPEQHRIVAKIEELFSELDKGVEALKTTQQQLKVYRQAVLKGAFDDLKEQKEVGDVTAEYSIGLVKSNAEQNENGDGIPYIKMNNVDLNGNVDFSKVVFVEVDASEAKKYSLRKGDILINTRNSVELVGKTGIVREENPNCVFNNNLLRIRTKSEYNPLFIGYQLVSPWIRKQMTKEKKATTNICALYQRDIFPLRVKSTNLHEQDAIVQEIESRLSVADKIEVSIAQSLKQAEALRQSILKKAFEGKLVPQDPNDEPAEKLLARIRAERTAQTPLRSRRRPDSRPEALKRGPLV